MTDPLIDIIGRDFTEQLTSRQRAQVQDAIHENPEGIRRVATEVIALGDKADKPIAILLSRLNRGQHRTPNKQAQQSAARGSILDQAISKYRARIAAYPVGTDPTHHHGPAGQALEYAIEFTDGANSTDSEESLIRRLLDDQPTGPHAAELYRILQQHAERTERPEINLTALFSRTTSTPTPQPEDPISVAVDELDEVIAW